MHYGMLNMIKLGIPAKKTTSNKATISLEAARKLDSAAVKLQPKSQLTSM